MFQSTHPRGVRHRPAHGLPRLVMVSIHAPAWGATVRPLSAAAFRIRFNPRTRVGCDTYKTSSAARGSVFQSTHPRGVRPCATRFIQPQTGFQSTHPRGVRQKQMTRYMTRNRFQSTHPRGVRLLRHPIYSTADRFQSTHPRGVRLHANGCLYRL